MKSLCSAVAVLALILMVGCGGGDATPKLPVSAPLFTSTPVMSASEGSAYAYKLVATTADGGSVSFALTSAPTGATLNGDTIAWTPTAAQSRVKNDFIVTATRSGSAASATQSWSVTPSGTVRLSSDITLWSASGSKVIHIDYTATDPLGNPVVGPYALVPQADGTYRKLTGTGTADGNFSIPNVPAGYFWLVLQGTSYWTNSSSVDLGYDAIDYVTYMTPKTATTTFNFNFDGLDPIQAGGQLMVAPGYSTRSYDTLLDTAFANRPTGSIGLPQGIYETGGTTFQGSTTISTPRDYSKDRSAFVGQYNPVSLGDTTFLALGPSLLIPDPLWLNGGTNTVSGTLSSGHRNSLDLNVKGSAWQALLNGVMPSEVSFAGSEVTFAVQPYITQQNTMPPYNSSTIPVLTQKSPLGIGLIPKCVGPSGGYIVSSTGWVPTFYRQPAITTDKELGTVSYADPFPTNWPRVFIFCQGTGVAIPIPGTDMSLNLNLGYGLDTASPTNPVTPLVGPIRTVTIAGSSLYTPSTISTANPTISWTAPSVGVPFGYRVMANDMTALGSPSTGTTFLPPLEYNTSRTSLSLMLIPGHTYVFEFTAMADARANVEASPNRSALPRGYATSISAPITVDSAAAPVVIQ